MHQRLSRFRNALVAVLLLGLHTALAPSDLSAAEGQLDLQAGVAKIDITPQKPVRMSGYSSRKQLSTGVHDPLMARVVIFQSGAGRLVLVSTDLIGFYQTYEPIRDAICDRFQLEPHEVFLSGIHTHSGPTPTLSDHVHPNNLEYTQGLKNQLLKVIGQAIDNLQPVEMGVGRGYSPVGVNRREKQEDGSIRLGRNPYGPTDKEVLVMKLAQSDGTPTAALFDYATHATSLGPKNLQVSGDVLGLAAQFVEEVLAPSVTAPVFAGASGDIDPWYRVLPTFETGGPWVPETELLGKLLGIEVVHVFRDIQTKPASGQLKSELVTLRLPAKQTDQGDDKSATKDLNLTVARIGDTAIVGVGCELLTEIGMAIKAGSPFKHTFLITHCNGKAGYLPPKHLYEQGGYEIRSTGFGPDAAGMLVDETLKQLTKLVQ